jgi:hypothetical protein
MEWNARGSFLWIHGKRMPFQLPTVLPLIKMLIFKAGAGKSTLLYVMVLLYEFVLDYS